MALALQLPRDQLNTSTPETSPRGHCLTRSISDRLALALSPQFGSAAMEPGVLSSPCRKPHLHTPPRSSGGRIILNRAHTLSPSTPSTPYLRSTASLRSALGSNWTRAIVDLYQAQEPDELLESMQEIAITLQLASQKGDLNIKLCKKDVTTALDEKKRRLPLLFTPQVRAFQLLLFARFWDEDRANKIPGALLCHVFTFLPVQHLGHVAATCTGFRDVASCDAVWGPIYDERFPDHGDGNAVKAFRTLFKERLLDPYVGDLVEVAWKGKFRLESLDIYQGLAWWSAKVVDKSDGSRYKIHYPGWDPRWDEWVDRDRLRWTVGKNLTARISANDDVEIWCCGSNVPGAWLEAKVRKVKGDQYCVGRVLSSGALWVDRQRIRVSPKGARSLGSSIKGRMAPGLVWEASGAIAGVGDSCVIM